MGGQASRPTHSRLPLGPRRQGYAHAAEHSAGRCAMKPRDRISEALRVAGRNGEPALVAFLTAGYPDKSQFREHLKSVPAGADVVEIGGPFTDPIADGLTRQRSSQAALFHGASLPS